MERLSSLGGSATVLMRVVLAWTEREALHEIGGAGQAKRECEPRSSRRDESFAGTSGASRRAGGAARLSRPRDGRQFARGVRTGREALVAHGALQRDVARTDRGLDDRQVQEVALGVAAAEAGRVVAHVAQQVAGPLV